MIITNRTEMACALNLEGRVVFSYKNLSKSNYAAPQKSAIIDADDVQRKRFEICSRPQEEHPIIIG